MGAVSPQVGIRPTLCPIGDFANAKGPEGPSANLPDSGILQLEVGQLARYTVELQGDIVGHAVRLVGRVGYPPPSLSEGPMTRDDIHIDLNGAMEGR